MSLTLLLNKKGFIKSGKNSKLGFMSHDVDDEGLIILEKNLAPKTYKYEYINEKDEAFDNDKCTMKCKGIPKKYLDEDMYDNYDKVTNTVVIDSLRKKNKKLTKQDKEDGVQHFTIVNNEMERTFMKSEWNGMIYKDGEYYPKGYEF